MNWTNCSPMSPAPRLGRKRGQVAIYILIALVIVALVTVYFLVRDRAVGENIPPSLVPVFDFYLSCIESEARTAIRLAGTQGGYVSVENYVPGSEYAPFSSNLNFLGFPVPYWYYVAGNGIIREQVPSSRDIETEIADYVQEGVRNCYFEDYRNQGFLIDLGEADVSVSLKDNLVEINVDSELDVSKDSDSGSKSRHEVVINSKLGKFYKLGLEIYQKEKSEAFLENYAVDTMRLYAPVDGVEIQCGPKVWATQDVISDLKNGLEENFKSIKFDGNYYRLADDRRNYFVVDKAVDEAVNVFYWKDWPTKVEISGENVDDEIITAEPVGTQEGLGAMGFCYVPYHFVYDLSFPAMIQIYNTEELFQFPVVVIVDNNVPRGQISGASSFVDEEDFDLCAFSTQEVEVNIFDINLNPVDANISYECFDQRCRLGQSRQGYFVGNAPACYNGYLHLRAEGYAEKKQLFSSNDEFFADVILEREFENLVSLKMDGQDISGTAVVSFIRDDGKTTSVSIPGFETVKLSEGSYEVRVYVYGNSSVRIPATSKTECVDVPREDLLAIFGGTTEKCFTINIPATNIDYALIGGGKLTTYLLEDSLRGGAMTINVNSLPRPNSIEQLQQNFELFDQRRVEVIFS